MNSPLLLMKTMLLLASAPTGARTHTVRPDVPVWRITAQDTAAVRQWLEARHLRARHLGSGILEAGIPTDSLESLGQLPGIVGMESAPRHVRHELDASRTLVQGAPVHAGTNLGSAHHGTKALVGIVDVGFDLGHPAFFDSNGTSRIVRVWDHTNASGKPPSGFSTGSLFSGTAIASLGRTGSLSHHGTHVAGLAAGRTWAPSGGDWWGVADDARIVLVECGSGCKSMNDGVKYIYQLADSLKLPAVVNLSWGNLNGPRDGKGTDCVLMGSMTGPGKLAVVSAGNSGGQAGHAVHTFAGDTARLSLQVSTGVETSGQDTIRKVFFNEVELWGDSALTYKSWVEFLDTSGTLLTTSTIETAGRTIPKNLSQTLLLGKDTMWVTGLLEKRSGKGGTQYSISTTRPGTLLRVGMTATTGTVNAWVWEDGLEFLTADPAKCPKCIVPDHDHMLSDKATCPNVISVGAVDPSGTATWFTSKGPGYAARPKPDISAPGLEIVSSLNSGVNNGWQVAGTSGAYTWGPMSGTSMSAPLVAGTLALLLEQDPTLATDSAWKLLKGSATVHDAASGWAVLDVYSLFQRLDPATAVGIRKEDASSQGNVERRWITPEGRRIAIPAGAAPRRFHPGGIAWLQECRGGTCSARGIAKP